LSARGRFGNRNYNTYNLPPSRGKYYNPGNHMSAPRWAVGMRRVTEGIYVDPAGVVHFDIDGLLHQLKWPKTPKSVETVERAVRGWVAKRFPQAQLTKVDRTISPEADNARDRR
jgi:hypothetical protein